MFIRKSSIIAHNSKYYSEKYNNKYEVTPTKIEYLLGKEAAVIGRKNY